MERESSSSSHSRCEDKREIHRERKRPVSKRKGVLLQPVVGGLSNLGSGAVPRYNTIIRLEGELREVKLLCRLVGNTSPVAVQRLRCHMTGDCDPSSQGKSSISCPVQCIVPSRPELRYQ